MIFGSNTHAGRGRFLGMVVVVSGLTGACDGDRNGAAEPADFEDFELSAAGVPDSPTNAYADRADAAAFGRRLFFDKRMSSDGTVACASCHDAATGFSDERQVSEGIDGQLGARHAMPITSAALQPFLLWDGRADSVWRQPLLALENAREMNFTRTDVARFIATNYAAEYESIFGVLPDLSLVPGGARPGDASWQALSQQSQDDVQRVFVNVGKSIEAYERLLVCKDTRFDRWVRGEAELSATELEGAARFQQRGCDNCHSGVAFSDGGFHNLGLSRTSATDIDNGRAAGLVELLNDNLNGAGSYSDAPEFGAARLAEAALESGTRGAFRTASLRGVTQRLRFGHVGQHIELAEFIEDTYRRGGRRNGRGDGDGDGDIVGALDPILNRVNVNDDDAEVIVEFLRTLECQPLPAELSAP